MDKHHWVYCAHCQCAVVICGTCGNNTCNGGEGQLADGSACDACASAYQLMLSRNGIPEAVLQQEADSGTEDPLDALFASLR